MKRLRGVLCILPVVLAVWFARGNPVQNPEGKSASAEEIIKAFSARETEFYEAWMQYTYRQTADIRILSLNGMPLRDHLVLVSEVVFKDDGTREVRLLQKRGALRALGWTAEDTEVINNLQPFALTAKELPKYNLKYEGKERVDELNCHVFSVKPKSTKGGIFFEGRIWVDDQDLQVVRTVGKPVPQRRENQFPDFETIRQIIDEKYWFPTWTHADSKLRFGDDSFHIEETITYEGYKRFGSKATIDFGPAKPPDKPE